MAGPNLTVSGVANRSCLAAQLLTDLSRGGMRAHSKARPDLHRSEWLPIFGDIVRHKAGVKTDLLGTNQWFGDNPSTWTAGMLQLT